MNTFETPQEKRRRRKVREKELDWAARDRGLVGPGATWNKMYNVYRRIVAQRVSPVLFESIQEEFEYEAVKRGIISAKMCELTPRG